MLKKYNELTDEEKERVKVMYSNLTSQSQYLYNFDDNGHYSGRQYAPPLTVVATPTESKKAPPPEPVEKPKRKRRTKKK